MAEILSWDMVNNSRFTYEFDSNPIEKYVYKIDKIPDFSSERFLYLGKETEARIPVVLRRQLDMLRGFQNLGSHVGISFRIVKDQELTIYIVFRQKKTDDDNNKFDSKIQNYLISNLYSFEKIDTDPTEDIEWANEVCEIVKEESLEDGTKYPFEGMEQQKFYVPYMWTPVDNNMDSICSMLMSYNGKAIIDITIVPTELLDKERSWIDENLRQIRDSYNGEKLKDKDGKTLWQGEGIPSLKTPLENFEKILKQYDTSRVCLSSIRIFCENEVKTLGDAFLNYCVKNTGILTSYYKGFPAFEYLKECYKNVDISVKTNSLFWNRNQDSVPFTAQRMNRLVCVEEIAYFFRLPIPRTDFIPGFKLDTGLKDFSGKKHSKGNINLGYYLDETNEAPVLFDKQQFAKHGLIVGVPGSGKTTAMFNLLYQFWVAPEDQRIPFIVLEPAKTEYRALKSLPEFANDLMIFTLGDEGVSPFRFNPLEVLPGIKIESHISKLLACFIGAFNLDDPLPILLEQAIRKTYLEKGWYDDSKGGDEGLETPTITDLYRNAEDIASNAGYSGDTKNNIKSALLERLNSLRRGSKGRMLDTPHSIPMEDMMNKPLILELDCLNGDEKALLMMFLLNYVYEYCKIRRISGSPLKHMLVVEEAHNLIGSQGPKSDFRASPKEKTIELFTNMLAEMRALGQGILIADQLPTAIAPQAVKQTNVKILMRETSKDDREEIGNTMDLNEDQMHRVVNFKTGHAYLYHEGENRVRLLRMINFKGEHQIEESITDDIVKAMMEYYENDHPELYYPFAQCKGCCKKCNRRARNQAEAFVKELFKTGEYPYVYVFGSFDSSVKDVPIMSVVAEAVSTKYIELRERYGETSPEFAPCVYIQVVNTIHTIVNSRLNNSNLVEEDTHWIEFYKNRLAKEIRKYE